MQHKRQLIWEELMDRERRLRAAKEVAAFHQAAAAAAAAVGEARPRACKDTAAPARAAAPTPAAPSPAKPAVPAVTPTAAQPLTLAVAAAAALRRNIPAEPAAVPVAAGGAAGGGAPLAAPAALPRYRPAHSITTAPSLEELYQDVNAAPAAPPADVMMPGRSGALVKVLSSKDEETLALQAAARDVPDTPALVNAESATAATPGAERTASKLLDAFELPSLGAAQGSNTGTVLEAAAAAASAAASAAVNGGGAETGDASAADVIGAGNGSGSGGSGEQNVSVGPRAPADGMAARSGLSAALEARGEGTSVLSDTRRGTPSAKELKRAKSI